MFPPFIAEAIGAYVYVLIDPRDQRPFYIGKGNGNRVFQHAEAAMNNPLPGEKIEKIRAIIESGLPVSHLILRHALTDQAAFEVECALIDFCSVLDHSLTNIVSGHHSLAAGVMTTDEITRKFSADPLDSIEEGFVLININKTYRKAKGQTSYYEATRKAWAIKDARIPRLKYALSEYKGFIVDVFEISDWYQVPAVDRNGKHTQRWAFNGKQAMPDVRLRYFNKRVIKRPGAANPIRYKYAS